MLFVLFIHKSERRRFNLTFVNPGAFNQYIICVIPVDAQQNSFLQSNLSQSQMTNHQYHLLVEKCK